MKKQTKPKKPLSPKMRKHLKRMHEAAQLAAAKRRKAKKVTQAKKTVVPNKTAAPKTAKKHKETVKVDLCQLELPLDRTPDLSADGSASVFPTGEARSVNVGTERKPRWVVEGPEPSAADRQWAREVALSAINQLSARVQNLGQSPTLESSQDDARKSDGAAGSGDTSGMSMRAESPQPGEELL